MVPKPPLRLVNAVVFRERAVPHLLPRDVWCPAKSPKHVLEQCTNCEGKIPVKCPDLAQGSSVPGLVPHGACKVPEVHGLSVCNEEGFAVDALVVERDSGQDLVRVQEGLDSEEVAEGYVLDVCEVEQVLVGANLELGLALAVCADHRRQQLDVAFAEDASRSNGAGEEVGGCAIGFEDGGLSVGFGRRVVLGLRIACDHWPFFCCVDELGFRAEDHGCRARVYEDFYTGILGGLEEVLRSFDVHLVVYGGWEMEVGGRSVDDGIGLQLGEQFLQGRKVGDVAVMVRDLRSGIAV